ncbi:DNA methyltransferase [Novosphingobium taihuense]|uniref:site-specific DNA-methyltransferase (adenine-specific) n=1 Tax=Novosphingobium taihuense TaxID=260085 RepID=A0A7W7EVL3_9SPHN|nr:DNA methyltransferase [Novosphingobium taihuense]MBB4615181.1 site-specific DNA-methyltransferase (adenine-specific) [Novosphingobium taihuense]TWH84217.1 site-specific DNA-methyltransferase (adenine-specific) [Novosphingobium taihuense]
MTNTLYYGDNLHVLREHVKDESVDLIYLDPPFNSNANYNILFKSPEGHNSDAQIEAFEDTWHWNDSAEAAFDEVMRSGNTAAFELLRAMRGFLGDNDMMAYLAMMAVRLLELHRVLKPTGSLYLHCDPTASHYLKLLLDGVFGGGAFTNEIIWERTAPKGHAFTRFPSSHDVILFYRKNGNAAWNPQFGSYDESYVESHYSLIEEGTGRRYQLDNLLNPNKDRPNLTYEFLGVTKVWRWTKERMQRAYDDGRVIQSGPGKVPRFKRYLDEQKGMALTSVWTDIPPLNSQAQERLGYPTQKPLALLERIIAASSNEGHVVLDPFCGCGTAVHAAQKLGRRWLGIDVTHLAISLIEKRMKDAFPGADFTVEGRPQDLGAALDLAERDKYQFQWWAVSLVDALPFGGKKKGADGGIDGLIYFKPDGKRTEKALVSVKGGKNVDVKMIRDLHSAMEREKAPFGVFICAGLPTKPMEKEAAAVGLWQNEYTGRSHPRLQILTLAELFKGKRPDIPWVDASVMKSAKREDTSRQGNLL